MITKAQHLSQVIQKEHLKEGEKAGKKRKPIIRTHGFRKFVETTFTNLDLNDSKREILLGRGLPGQREAYYRPTANDLLQEYLKCVDALTINEENRLKQEVETLKTNKSEIQQLKEEFEQLKKATRDHINSQVKELQDVKISDALAEMLYPEDKARLDRAIAKYKKEHNIIDGYRSAS